MGGRRHRYLTAAALILLVVSAACQSRRSSDRSSLPPGDVPIYGMNTLIAREFGPGGYKLTYTTTSGPEAVKVFFKNQMKIFQWTATGETHRDGKPSLMYYRKGRRLINILIVADAEDMGCRFVISETGG